MGLCSCFGNDVDQFYDSLLAGKSGVDMIDRFDTSTYPTKFAAQIRNFSSEGLIAPKEDRRLDDCLRYTLVSGKKALAQAGLDDEALAGVSNASHLQETAAYIKYVDMVQHMLTNLNLTLTTPHMEQGTSRCSPQSLSKFRLTASCVHDDGSLTNTYGPCHLPSLQLDKQKIGVLIGSGMGGLSVYSDGVKALLEKGYKKVTPFLIPYIITNMGAALLAIEKGFMGPNYSISTACATANYCFYSAANHIRR